MFDASFTATGDTGSTFAVPAVVFDEVVNKFEEVLNASIRQLGKYAGDLSQYLGRRVSYDLIDLRAERSAYEDWLRRRLAELQVSILPYPSITHQEITQRALARRKPFCGEGQKGYRDALIWETVLDAATDEEVLFVCSNSRDFASAKRPNELHADLKADLETRKMPSDHVRLVEGLDVLHTKFFLPRREVIAEIRSRLQADTFEGFKVEDWIDRHLVDLLNGRGIGNTSFGLPEDYEDLRLIQTTYVKPLNVVSARYVGNESVFLLLEVEVEGEFEFMLDTSAVDDLEWRPFRSYEISLSYSPAYDYQIFYVTLALEVNLAEKHVAVPDVVKVWALER